MRTLGFLLRKEFTQIFRDRTMLRMLVGVPIIQLLVLANAATFEVRRADVFVVDRDGSATSRGLVQRLLASGHFELAGSSVSMAVANEALLDRRAAVILALPESFERDLVRTGTARVQLVLSAEDGAVAGIIRSYVARILTDYGSELADGGTLAADRTSVAAGPTLQRTGPRVVVRSRGWYNPELEYDDYMVPGILVVLVTVVGVAITSMNIVREKEIGTLEQLNVTPVTKAQFIAGKLVPFSVIALADLALGLLVARLVFEIPMRGSLLLVFVAAVVYLVAALGIGLLVSTLVETQQQAMFVSFSIAMVFLLMSGLFTPIQSMPGWAQVLAQFSPVKHFIVIMRGVLVRGAGFADVQAPLYALAAFGVGVLTLAVRQHSKTSAG